MEEARAQALLEKQINKGNVYNVVAGVQSKDGKVDFVGAAGKADVAAGVDMTPETPYALASITKMYTAAVILKLHEQGLLDLDATISTYLPASLFEAIHVYKGKDYSRNIKVYQLVNQTSGLADYEADRPDGGPSILDQLKQGQDIGLNTQQAIEITRKLSPRFEPGARNETKAHYSNTNYRLLGAIMEAVTGKSAAENFDQMIFAPLDLQCTYLYGSKSPASCREVATLYLKDEAANIPKYLASNITDGAIVSTARESLAFLRAFFEGKLFDPKFLDRMTQRWNSIFFPMQYGYGMMRLNLPRILSLFFGPMPELIGHSGSTGSFAYYSPDKALYLAGTVNQIADPSKPIRLMMKLAALAT